ncbi:MAG: mannose-6-phosphate isomerase [Bacteroidetes bacterium]|nr:MAG: mannose-6-phosphate isomerase [Bacteroidota bacterium]
MKLPALYPFKFKPQLKEKVWGGTQLAIRLGKEGNGKMGESWEISGVKDNVSVVSNGILKGRSLTELLELYPVELLGKGVVERFGNEFPLLFKFIDAREDLSVQLHPNNAVAKERHNSFGKTEMWYVLNAERDARLILGFDREMDQATYLKYLSEGNITDILHSEKVSEGDAFFIAPGTVHAIGAGVLLAEIQQTSDITYRIYDWDRPGTDGEMRELHTDLALDVIDFGISNARLQFSEIDNETIAICKSVYFETNSLRLTQNFQKDISKIDSFVVYMCIKGEARIISDENSVLSSMALAKGEQLKKGETLLIPACTNHVNIETEGVTLLEVYVPGNS